ncbi:MAG TPA: M28 family peptidase [Bryobacteraceae bacterium]|nr:M28 family peptidase [Bryobacteraceae bacterium]
MRTIGAVLLACAVASAQSEIRGFPATQVAAQRELESKAHAIPQPANLRAYLEKMSAEPHIAGSSASRAVADYTAGLLRQWGLQVRVEEFEAVLPYPKSRLLHLTAPTKFTARLDETRIAEDRDSGDKDQVATYNSYAASGDVTAPLIYVNYGIPEDYERLKKLGIDPKGKIVIARYGRSWRGTKAKVAQENGALGCLIYSDPRDDGYYLGDVYPKGAYRPPQGVQRGSVMDLTLYTGDPLSPGWASEKGARKLALNEATNLIKIPVLPISYGDAQPLLAALDGPVAPEQWRGALPITYHIGPGPATVHMKVEIESATRPLYNVIATIAGSELPDEWVIYGNHHDAWVNGAQDPGSGASVLLETARTLSELLNTGWKPKRTIKLALWDGEEFGLIGSTEWVEKHEAELKQKTLVYFNTDMTGKLDLGVGGSPSLHVFMREIVRDVLKGETTPFVMGPVGSGSDYTPFLHHSGIASVNAGFGESGGVYHSIYDSFDWYTRFSDKDFTKGRSLAQIMTTGLLRASGAPVAPFEFRQVAIAIRGYMADLSAKSELQLGELHTEATKLHEAADAYEAAYKKALETPSVHTKLNRILLDTERALAPPAGLRGREWYKHQLMTPGAYTGYSAKTLPAIREPSELQRWAEANAGVKDVVAAVSGLRLKLQAATELLSQ